MSSNTAKALWHDKFVAERVTAEFNFTRGLAYGDTIATVQMGVTLLRGTDPLPGAILYGAAIVKGGRVFHRLHSGVAECTYLVECRVTTANSDILILAGVLPVKAL